MSKQVAQIREASGLDRENIREVHLRAFPESEGELVAALAASLLREETTPATFGLVAEVDGNLVGHVGFSPVWIDGNDQWVGYILAPLGVTLEHQNLRIGSQLVKSGIARLSEQGVNAIFVYGDPKYYGKFGFTAETANDYAVPYALQYPFGWQAKLLTESDSQSMGTLKCVASLSDPQLW